MLALLLEAALRSLILGAAVWLGHKALRVRNPQVEMTAWTVVLAASLVMPLIMRNVVVTIPALPPPVDQIAAPGPGPLAIAPAHAPRSSSVRPDEPEMYPEALEPEDLQLAAQPRSHGTAWSSIAFGLYLIVAGTMLLRLLTGVVLIWRMRRTARPINEPWTAGLDVRVSDAVVMPVTFASTILLPPDCTEWNAIKRRAVLCHERSHIVRADFYVLLLAALHRCLFWFSPLSWWLTHRLAEVAEIISDNAAIEVIGDRASYAEILLDVARHVGTSGRPTPAGIAMARPRTLRARVEQILTTTVLPAKIGWGRRALLATALVPAVAVCAMTIAHGESPASRGAATGSPAAGDLAAGASAQGTPAPRRAVTVAAKILDGYTGFYAADPKVLPDLVLTVTREGEHLFIERTGRAKLEIFPENDHDFFYGVIDFRITFVRDADGRATDMVLHQNGMDIEATRTDEAAARRATEVYAQRLADQARPRTTVSIDPTLFDRYLGYYAVNPRLVFHVTREGDRFFTQGTGQPKVELFPASETEFFARIVPTQKTFVIDAQGQVTGFVLHVGGHEYPARRVDEAAAEQADAAFEYQAKRHAAEAQPRTAIAVDPQRLDRYVGLYEAGPQRIFVVTRDGDQLLAQATGEQRFPIFPSGEREFFYKARAAQITFVSDGQGRPTELVLHQDGRDTRAPRIADVPAAGSPPAVVDPSLFDNYVGSYEPNSQRGIVTVTREGDHLFVQETAEARSEIIPRSTVSYTAAGGRGPNVVFELGEQGRASSLIFYDEARGAVQAMRVDAANAKQVEEQTARRLADAPEHFLRQVALPGSEAALRHYLEAAARGTPDYDQMTSRFAELTRQQMPVLLYWLTALGTQESLAFKGVGPGGFDIYDVNFAHGRAEVRIGMTPEGKILGTNIRPDGDGTPGGVVGCVQESTLRPTTGAAPIRLMFLNRTGSDIRLFLVDFEGKRTASTVIGNDRQSPLLVTVTQPVVVTDSAEHCLEIVLPGTSTQTVAVTSAAPDTTSSRAAARRTTPLPGGEAALRQLIDGIRRGEPDYSRLSAQAGEGVRQQSRLFAAILAKAGEVHEISFVRPGLADEDIYEVKCENGTAEVRLDLLKDGRIGSIALGPQ
jgi:hypothetical protein